MSGGQTRSEAWGGAAPSAGERLGDTHQHCVGLDAGPCSVGPGAVGAAGALDGMGGSIARGGGGRRGALHPYCSSLPPRCSTLSPLFWTEEEAALLEGSQCLDLVTSYREFLEAKLEELEEGLFRSNRSLFPSEVFTPEAFLRAFGCLRARAHPPLDQGEGIALVPMADLVQHSGASSSSWEVREDRGLFGAASSGDRKVSLTADRPYVPGEPIEMNFLLGREDVAAAGGLESQLAVGLRCP